MPDADDGDGRAARRRATSADAPGDTGGRRPDADARRGRPTTASPRPIHRRSGRGQGVEAAGAPPRGPRTAPPGRRPRRRRPTARPAARSCAGSGSSLVVVVVGFIVFLAGAGIDLWTDAIWYKSVGFDSVFWTRLGVAGRPVRRRPRRGARRPAVQPVARRPPRAPARPRASGPDPPVADRARRGAAPGRAQRARMAGGPGAASAAPFPRGTGATGISPASTSTTSRTSSRSRRGSSRRSRSCIALGIAGSVSGAWNTLLLWINRVPFSPDRHRRRPGLRASDISFFLFDLPFFRFVQSLINGLLLASPRRGRRPLPRRGDAGRRGVHHPRPRPPRGASPGCTCSRSPSATSWTSTSSSTARPAPRPASPSPTPTRGSWPTTSSPSCPGSPARSSSPARSRAGCGRWARSSSSGSRRRLVLGRLYPEAIQRLTVDPNEFAQEQRYIGNNIAMTRLAFGLDQWETAQLPGRRRRSRRPHVVAEADTFTNARLWDYRPLQTTLDQLQTVRQYYDFKDVDTDRYQVDGDAPPGHALGPRAGDRPQPAGHELGQPAGHLHPRHRRRDGPRQRGDPRGPAATSGSGTCRRSRRAGAPDDRASRASTSARRTTTTS